MATAKRSKAEQAQVTRDVLISIAHDEFSSKGYAKASTEAIVQRAQVTRGALYHHFKGKKDLFYAVFEAAQADIGGRVLTAAKQTDDPWQQFLVGCRAFLKASLDPNLQQIVIMDAPAVLGWEVWRNLDEINSVRHLQHNLEDLVARNILQPVATDVLARLLAGAMNEAALWIPQQESPEQALYNAMRLLEAFLRSLKVDALEIPDAIKANSS
ncbi:MAG: TetR/AcrR family transcriptional regulator [Deinococcota bacterium]